MGVCAVARLDGYGSAAVDMRIQPILEGATTTVATGSQLVRSASAGDELVFTGNFDENPDTPWDFEGEVRQIQFWAAGALVFSIETRIELVDFIEVHNDNDSPTPDVWAVLMPGADDLFGSPLDDYLDGYGRDDSIHGQGGNDRLYGQSGDDVLVGGAGSDTLDGGVGADWAFYTQSASAIVIDLADGTSAGGDAAGDTLFNIENVRATSDNDSLSGDDAANILEGLDGNDSLIGAGGDDLLRGAHGDDTIDGGRGDDIAIGGPGQDSLDGGAGDDALRGNSQNDLLDGGTGDDRVFGNIGGDRVRGNDGDDFLWGLSGNDRLYGEADDDVLRGGFGGDILQGGRGADTLNGGGGRDIFQFQPGDGHDIIQDFEPDTVTFDLFDLHRWFLRIGYTGSTPVTDGIVRAVADGDGDAVLQIDDGGFQDVATVTGFTPPEVAQDRFFVITDDYWFGS